MIEDITRQPQEGVIGGLRDLTAEIRAVAVNRSSAVTANVSDGFTSTEQGRDHDPFLVALREVLTPDEPGNAASKAIPWVALLLFVAIGYLVVRKF